MTSGTREYVESVLRRKKSIPYKPYIHGKHIESIIGTRENMTKKVFNLNNTIPHSVRLVNPIGYNNKPKMSGGTSPPEKMSPAKAPPPMLFNRVSPPHDKRIMPLSCPWK